jgi:predicted Zn-dependent protease
MSSSPSRKERLDRAVALKKSRDLPGALRLLEELVAEDRGDLYAASHLAHALLLRGRARDALALADEVVSRDPASGFTHFVRAEALVRLRRPSDAAAAYDEAIASGFASPYLHARLADARTRAGDTAGARAAAERGLAVHPGDGRLLLALGRIERAAGDSEAATRHIEQAAQSLPGDAYVYKEMIATRARARGPEAIEEMKRLLRIPSQAQNPHLHDELARLHAAAGDADSAIAEARRAHELAPASRLYHRRLAFALVRARQDAEAVRALEACLDDEPEEPTLHRSYLAARRRLGTLGEAEAFYLTLLRRHPEANKLHGWIRKLAGARSPETGDD